MDPEQFKRVVVNLVDNAAEAMQDSLVKKHLHMSSPSRPPATRWNWWWPTPAAAYRPKTKRACFFRTFPPRDAAPDWDWPS